MTSSGSANPPGVSRVEVPREIVNADSVYVVNWWVVEGDHVEAGARLCDIETSKAVVTVEAAVSGHARLVAGIGDEVPVGGLLGYVTEQPGTPLPEDENGIPLASAAGGSGASPATNVATAQGAVVAHISAKARRRIAELGLDAALFAGRTVVREEDVLAVAAQRESLQQEGRAPGGVGAARDFAEHPRPDGARGPSRLQSMGAIQRRVARVMERSVATVPTSSLERTVDLVPVRERARTLGVAHNCVVTEVDLLVHAVASSCRDFSEFNGHATADHDLRLFDRVNVGVAVDVAGDLFVVVVRDAAAKQPEAVAKELRGLQYLAARQKLAVEHLTGGTVTVTSMLGRGVQRFVPILYPDQAAIVGLADPEPGSTKAALVLVFDHRVANGGRAAAFLAAVAEALASPGAGRSPRPGLEDQAR